MTREQLAIYQEWIERCVNEAKKPLTKWEEEFLENISDQIARTGSLSVRQCEILERIYSEKT